jgi:CheY-like chemotaxis protein
MLKVLVVDDNPDMCVLMEQMLKKLKCTVYQTFTGHHCEVQAFQVQPNLILLDYDMPIQNGIVTCRNLRDKGYEGKIVIISALSKTIGTPEALAVGANGFLSKPVSFEALQNVVEAI